MGKQIRGPVLECVDDLLIEVAVLASDVISDDEGRIVTKDMASRLGRRLHGSDRLDGQLKGGAFYDAYHQLDALLRRLDPEAVVPAEDGTGRPA